MKRLAWRQDEGHRPSEPVGNLARLGPIAPTRAAQGFTGVPLSWRAPFWAAPAAFWCARMLVPSRNVIPSWTPRSWARSSGPGAAGQEQQPLPHAQPRPADEGLSRLGPGPQVRRNGAPLGPVLMPPNDRRECAAQILGRGLALGPARLDQGLQSHPLRVR